MTTLRDETRFWDILDGARPSMAALRTSLEALDREGLENFYGFFESLAWDVRSDEGTYVDDAIGYLSEDGAEDLANWVVSQGRAYWERIREDLSVLGPEYLRMSDVQAGRPSETAVKWELEPRDSAYGRVGHLSLVVAMYAARFDASIFDVAGEVSERVESLRRGRL